MQGKTLTINTVALPIHVSVLKKYLLAVMFLLKCVARKKYHMKLTENLILMFMEKNVGIYYLLSMLCLLFKRFSR